MIPLPPLWQFVCLLAVHWLGDFVLQSHWMGINKSKSNPVLILHVTIYTTTLLIGSVILFGYGLGPLFAVINGILHFCTDYVTSRITSRLYAAKQYHYFFVVIGFDQLIHQATLAATIVWLLP